MFDDRSPVSSQHDGNTAYARASKRESSCDRSGHSTRGTAGLRMSQSFGRRALRVMLILLLPLAFIAGTYWYGRHVMASDNAYVEAHNATMAVGAEDLSQPVMLVATERLDGSVFEHTVLVVAPIADGHVGFVVNRPTDAKLGDVLRPSETPPASIVEPVYIGGPDATDVLVALTRVPPGDEALAIALQPNLFAVFDREHITQILSTHPNEARYLAGLTYWDKGKLDQEVRAGKWALRRVEVSAVFRHDASAVWDELQEKTDQRPRPRVSRWAARGQAQNIRRSSRPLDILPNHV